LLKDLKFTSTEDVMLLARIAE
jgi:14-3-3 protein epsilon